MSREDSTTVERKTRVVGKRIGEYRKREGSSKVRNGELNGREERGKRKESIEREESEGRWNIERSRGK